MSDIPVQNPASKRAAKNYANLQSYVTVPVNSDVFKRDLGAKDAFIVSPEDAKRIQEDFYDQYGITDTRMKLELLTAAVQHALKNGTSPNGSFRDLKNPRHIPLQGENLEAVTVQNSCEKYNVTLRQFFMPFGQIAYDYLKTHEDDAVRYAKLRGIPEHLKYYAFDFSLWLAVHNNLPASDIASLSRIADINYARASGPGRGETPKTPRVTDYSAQYSTPTRGGSDNFM